MAVIRMVRFTVEPSRVDGMIARRADLIAATRRLYPGLLEARLTRVDDRTWLDLWRWESMAHAEAAVKGADAIPGLTAALGFASNLSAESAEVVVHVGEVGLALLDGHRQGHGVNLSATPL